MSESSGRSPSRSPSPSPVAPPKANGVTTWAHGLPSRHQEVVRLIVQSLDHFGYSKSALSLQNESGIMAEKTLITKFRKSVLDGNWDDVGEMISVLQVELSESDTKEVCFLIHQQKFMELLESQNLMQALHVLRNDLSPLNIHLDRIHMLASFIFASNFEYIQQKANWKGPLEQTRHTLLVELQRYLSPTLMMPENRLSAILDKYVQLQKLHCLYHNSSEDISLLTDHKCTRLQFPCETTHVLTEHTDEVWMVAFSHRGEYLVSISRDQRIIVWDVNVWKAVHIMTDTQAPTFVAWSPDDTSLLTTSTDKTVKMWSSKTGQRIHTFQKHILETSTCAWLPDSAHFVSGGGDKQIILWNVDGSVVHVWNNRAQVVAVTPDARFMVAAASMSPRIWVYSLEERSNAPICVLSEMGDITSFYAAQDSRHMLVKLAKQEVHLWDLQEKRITRRYASGWNDGNFVLRACLGGLSDNFVLSGCEDSHIYVWHKELQVHLETLSGHTKCVSSVSWNPSQNMFASGSDDTTIRIWEPPERNSGTSSSMLTNGNQIANENGHFEK